MAFADLPGVQLFYTDAGSGAPALLLVHGYTCDSHDWSWQLPFFTKHHRVIAVDLRGHGRSSAPPTGYSAAELAGDLALLLEHLNPGPVIAFGHSLGGAVVSVLAAERPELLAGLVCVDPAYLLPDALAAQAEPFLAAFAADPVSVAQQILGNFSAPADSPALRTWQTRRAAGVPPHVLLQTYESQIKGMTLLSHSRPVLARRACPVLSFYADPARAAVEAELFNDAKSRWVAWEGAGHWLHQERPAEFNALVAAWIGGLPK